MMPPLLKKKSFWILLASFFVLAWVGQTAYRTLADRQEEEKYRLLQEGDEMPATMPFLSLEGKYSNYSDYRGKVVLVNFWAAWCAPCLKEMPSIYALQGKFKEKGLVVLGVAMDENLETGVSTLNRIVGPAPFLMVKGLEQAIANRFPIEGLPYTVVIDRVGKIRYARPGERDWNDKGSVALVEEML
jgi:thiol-disulfide isomerase/thioredoxin